MSDLEVRELMRRAAVGDELDKARVSGHSARAEAAKKVFHYEKPAPFIGNCEGQCKGRLVLVRWESSRTCYSDSPLDGGRNRDVALCAECAREHHEYWDEMWADYYGSRGCS